MAPRRRICQIARTACANVAVTDLVRRRTEWPAVLIRSRTRSPIPARIARQPLADRVKDRLNEQLAAVGKFAVVIGRAVRGQKLSDR
jgi:hypothetical protein